MILNKHWLKPEPVERQTVCVSAQQVTICTGYEASTGKLFQAINWPEPERYLAFSFGVKCKPPTVIFMINLLIIFFIFILHQLFCL